jgi:cytochrome P450
VTFYLLSEFSWADARLAEEVASLPDRPATEDVDRLVYTRMVLEESMRLYPPVPLWRRALAEDKLGQFGSAGHADPHLAVATASSSSFVG